MDDTRPVPGFTLRELRILKDATAAYLAVLQDFDQWAEQAADVNRRVRPDFAAELDGLRDQVRAAMLTDLPPMGTPAVIARALSELLGVA